MLKTILACAFTALLVVACGGGGGESNPQPASKALTISMYGNPLVSSASAATARAQLNAISKDASPNSDASDAQSTVQTLKDALAARGVTADVTAQVMDGTSLHQIVMGENSGLPPTPDQFKSDPSEIMIVHFQLDDMVTPSSDPVQEAAINQFIQDLIVFSQRAAVAGKAVYAVAAIPTCDSQYSAAFGLNNAFSRAFVAGAAIRVIGGVQLNVAFDTSGNAVPSPDLVHLGADCRTPDAFLQNERVASIADTIAAIYKETSGT